MIVFLDANVLFVAALRDLILQLAVDGAFALRWSVRVEEEWIRSLRARRPDLQLASLLRTRDLMRAAIPDCLVVSYEDLPVDIDLPDRDDRHVLAAALACKADVLLTFNTRDFPEETLARILLRNAHPDAFLQAIAAGEPEKLLQAARKCRKRLRNPPMSEAAYVQMLRRCGLPRTGSFVEGGQEAG